MRRRRQAVTKPKAEINITSLLDITFVLLISFIIVAPQLKNGVELELPEVREAPAINQEKPLSLSVRAGDGREPLVYLEGQALRLEVLPTALQGEIAAGRAVALEGDRSVNWEQMAQVIAVLQRSGVANVGIMTQPRS